MAEDVRKVANDTANGPRAEAYVQNFSPMPMGSRIGELTIQSVLGAGDLGITYVAVQDTRDRRFAVKEYFPRAIAFRDGPTVRVAAASTPTYAWGLDRFLSEARAIAKIRHPAIVPVQAVMEGNGTGYMVMSLVVGRDLGVWLHELRRPPTQEELDRLIGPLVEGLNAAHSKELLHQDISPTNIVIQESGQPVLVDFGSTRQALQRRLGLQSGQEARQYIAPEILAGDGGLIGPCSDIYALSAVLYRAVTGEAPPPSDRRVLRDEMEPAAKKAKGKYRPQFLAAIDNALSFRPGERPSSISAWGEALRQIEAPKLPPKRSQPVEEAGEAVKPAASLPNGGRIEIADEAAQLDGGETLEPEALMDNPGFRAVFYGAVGGLIGAVAGALASAPVASIVFSSCYTDACMMSFLPFTAAAGAAVGIYFGMRHGQSTSRLPKPYPPSGVED